MCFEQTEEGGKVVMVAAYMDPEGKVFRRGKMGSVRKYWTCLDIVMNTTCSRNEFPNKYVDYMLAF